jgi:hypothetical protein
LEFLRFFSPEGRGGGDEDGPGDTDFWREDRLELREGVLYGVSVGVGREAAAAAAYSSSVSHAPAIVKINRESDRHLQNDVLAPRWHLHQAQDTNEDRQRMQDESFEEADSCGPMLRL